MTIKDLYEQYGSLIIQAEITQANINRVKQAIVNELNKPGITGLSGPCEQPKDVKE